MSKETKTVEVITELAIVKSIMKILKLDDAGKLEKFFKGEIRTCKDYIAQLEANQSSFDLQYKIDMAKLDRDIDDATEEVEQAYFQVSPEDVVNNAACTSFSSIYWANIALAESKLTSLKEKKANLEEKQENNTLETKEQIEKYQSRINKISKKA